MSRLEQLEAKWIALFDELCRDLNLRDRIAAPFLSVPAAHPNSILYVGKATSGEWHKNDFRREFRSANPKQDTQKRIEERKKCTRSFVEDEAPSYGGGFWPLARKLNLAAAEKWRSKLKTPLQHIAWTNLCKIGTVVRNPEGHVFEAQRSLAINTLRLEIQLYKPRLICFVTWDYKFDLVKEVIEDPSDASWDQTGNEQWIWWRPARNKLPAMVLTGHPERKARLHIEEWVAKVSDLLPLQCF